jgi:CRP-like cAMP-binding protein
MVVSLGRSEIDLLLANMEEHEWAMKDVVAAEGTADEAVHVVVSGEAVVRKAQGSRVDVATLRRGDCFGEGCLLRAEGTTKPAKRKTTVCVAGTKPLVTFTIRPEVLHGLPFMLSWLAALVHELAESSHAGIDAIVADRVQKSGGNVAALAAAAARTNSRVNGAGGKKQRESRASRESVGSDVPASAPAPTAATRLSGAGRRPSSSQASSERSTPSPSRRAGRAGSGSKLAPSRKPTSRA